MAIAGGARATYLEMLLQCARDYASLPDVRTLTVAQIVVFYDGLRPELRKHTKGKPELPSVTPRKHGR